MYKHNFIAVIKHKGKILRETGDEVCLPFGSQYSILLKNKRSRKVLVDIEVDGENVLAGKSLIIEGNSSQEIKGFMRNMSVTNRFKFIHKTKEISRYRGNKLEDGLISVVYRFERERSQPITVMKEYRPWSDFPYPRPRPRPDYYPDVKFTAYNYNTPLMSDSASYVTDYRTGGLVSGGPIKEEGITVKGSKITQEYQYGEIYDLEQRSYVITLRLKGEIKRSKKIVTKPLTVKTKLRCSTCGRRSKSSSTFCYNCGTYLR